MATPTKTPDEIKKGLECCGNYQSCTEFGEPKCPYNDVKECVDTLLADALALIQQLQADNAEKDKRIQQLERSLSFARDLADGLKTATVKQEQEIYVSEERNRQLEAQKAELLEKVEWLQAEQDALIGAVKDYGGTCAICKHYSKGEDEIPCRFCSEMYPEDEDRVSHWEWRGVQNAVKG